VYFLGVFVDKARWQRLRYFLDLIEARYREVNEYEEDASVIAELGELSGISRTTLDAWKFQGTDAVAAEKERDLTYEALSKLAYAARAAGLNGFDVLAVVCVIEGRQLVTDIPLATQVALSSRDVKAAVLESIAQDLRGIPKPVSRKTPKATSRKA
jgi:hypothetical protein